MSNCLKNSAAAKVEKSVNPQQQKMKDCNAQAASQSLSGDARKTFMGNCLKNSPTTPDEKPMTQQQKMKDCNAQATNQSLSGNARRTFMSGCLKTVTD
ncbi:PsiF family protein [Franconibacter daqui]|uniref:PsiF family protein n=1 Tax=Franconibacter daqui TaxID=2047724 RepID=UPI003BB003AE